MAGNLRKVPNFVSQRGNGNCRGHLRALQEAGDEGEQLSNRKNSGNYLLACLFPSPVTSLQIPMDWICWNLYCVTKANATDCLQHGPMLVSFAHMPFLQSGVSQGEGEAAAPRCSQQRSNASHYHPSALVPSLFVKAALLAKERCSFINTGNIYSRQLKIHKIVRKKGNNLCI